MVSGYLIRLYWFLIKGLSGLKKKFILWYLISLDSSCCIKYFGNQFGTFWSIKKAVWSLQKNLMESLRCLRTCIQKTCTLSKDFFHPSKDSDWVPSLYTDNRKPVLSLCWFSDVLKLFSSSKDSDWVPSLVADILVQSENAKESKKDSRRAQEVPADEFCQFNFDQIRDNNVTI